MLLAIACACGWVHRPFPNGGFTIESYGGNHDWLGIFG